MKKTRYAIVISCNVSKEKKDDLIIKIASDPEYREELYKKHGI